MGASCPFFGGEESNKLDLGFVKIYLESGHVYTISRAVYTVNMAKVDLIKLERKLIWDLVRPVTAKPFTEET